MRKRKRMRTEEKLTYIAFTFHPADNNNTN